jgi:hypothetical protein
VLSQLVTDAVTDRMDLDVWENVVENEGEIRETIIGKVEAQIKS